MYLSKLPNELLSLITSYLDGPKDVRNLTLTSARLNDFAKVDGWKALLKGRFALSGLDTDARNAIHGLTTLHRNYDRKAVVARYLAPPSSVTSLNTWEGTTWAEPHGQTMGYQPSIDSYEEIRQCWTKRREIVAWSAGTRILVRSKESGSSLSKDEDDYRGPHVSQDRTAWHTYKIPGGREGTHDVTAIKLLRPHQRGHNYDGVVFGTVDGQLSLLQFDLCRQDQRVQSYSTGLRGFPNSGPWTIRTVDISSADEPLMAATIGDYDLAIYPIRAGRISDRPLRPLSQVTPRDLDGPVGRIWSASFISNETISIGLGHSHNPIQIFAITPTGLSATPIRKLSLDARFCSGNMSDITMSSRTTVHPIIPVPPDAQAGSKPGDIFLSGGFDGIVRLHDLRSPHDFEAMYYDVTDDSTIYSLATQGTDRVIAGTSLHSLMKIFDLRLAGSNTYHSMSLIPDTQEKRKPRPGDYAVNRIVNEAVTHTAAKPITGGWNLFLDPRNDIRIPNRSTHRNRRFSRTVESPIYSLSVPSPTSPNLYAGVEDAVVNLTFASVADPHPDPFLAKSVQYLPNTDQIDIKNTYNASDDVLNLGMYEQGDEEALDMELVIQDSVGEGVRENAERRDQERFKI